MPDTRHMGGCSCGQIRYQLHAPALIVHACHCRDCQCLTGGTNAVNILIEAENVELLSGELVETVAATPSGAGQVISRCKTCHVAVWSVYQRLSTRYGTPVRFVRAGTLDDPSAFPPDVHIHTTTKQPHVTLTDGKPQFTAFYDLPKVWPDASLNRLTRGVEHACTKTPKQNGASPQTAACPSAETTDGALR